MIQSIEIIMQVAKDKNISDDILNIPNECNDIFNIQEAKTLHNNQISNNGPSTCTLYKQTKHLSVNVFSRSR